MNILERYSKPTPRFFRVMRNLGMTFATIGGTLIAAPINIPIWLYTISTYLIVAGTVATAISQAAVEDKNDPKPPNCRNHGI